MPPLATTGFDVARADLREQVEVGAAQRAVLA